MDFTTIFDELSGNFVKVTFVCLIRLHSTYICLRMRIITVILLIALYAIAAIQPYSAIIEYELNKSYIMEYLCENKDKPELACEGKCHLQDKIQEQQDQDEQDIPLTIKLQKEFVAINDVIHSNVFNAYHELEQVARVNFVRDRLTCCDIFQPPRV